MLRAQKQIKTSVKIIKKVSFDKSWANVVRECKSDESKSQKKQKTKPRRHRRERLEPIPPYICDPVPVYNNDEILDLVTVDLVVRLVEEVLAEP